MRTGIRRLLTTAGALGAAGLLTMVPLSASAIPGHPTAISPVGPAALYTGTPAGGPLFAPLSPGTSGPDTPSMYMWAFEFAAGAFLSPTSAAAFDVTAVWAAPTNSGWDTTLELFDGGILKYSATDGAVGGAAGHVWSVASLSTTDVFDSVKITLVCSEAGAPSHSATPPDCRSDGAVVPFPGVSSRGVSHLTFGGETIVLGLGFADVPEPGTLALLAAGLLGIGGAARRRSRA